MSDFARYITPQLLIPLAVVTALACFVAYYWRLSRPAVPSLPNQPKRRLTFSHTPHPMERRDVLPVLVLTAVYALTAFFSLGSLAAPQSPLDLKDGQPVTVELSQQIYLTKFRYFPGLGTGDYDLAISADGERWLTLWAQKDSEGRVTGYYWAGSEGYSPSYALPQHYADLFKWLEIKPDNPQNVRYLRITGRADYGQNLLELGELALYSDTGAIRDAQGLLNISPGGEWITATGADALFDERDTVPRDLSWYNSSYFDEIYHPRTAYEHLRGIWPYETSHPPLGKLIISLGIRLFGMTPFGWRFMGALFGVGMVPLIYLFLKNLFGKTVVATCGAALFAFDFMHLVQTRLATIDTYAVFFILLMYYFMYRYLALPGGAPFWKCALTLFFSGLFWGIGVACKWTVIYGGAGLAVLYFIGLWFKLRDWPAPPKTAGRLPLVVRKSAWTVGLLLCSVLFFVLIPAAIYTASYIPYAAASGVDLSLDNTLKGFGDSIPVLAQNLWGYLTQGKKFKAAAIPQDSLTGIMANNQWSMLTYHSDVNQSHPYSSRWYQWIVDARPILYYMDNSMTGYTTRFAAFNNPVVCWTGLMALLSVAVELFRRKCGKALFILIGYLSQLGPWLLISRTTYEYHYFPCLIFLVLAISYLMDGIVSRAKADRWQLPVYGLTTGAVAAYALFYPALIGLQVPIWYSSDILQWLPSWPL